MEVTSAKYVETDNGGNTFVSITATIDGTSYSVPLDPNNTHYAAILEWVDEGNTIQDAD